MQGKRVDRTGDDLPPEWFEPGTYGKDQREGIGIWYATVPCSDSPSRLEGWSIVEHEDGTITVDPSIKVWKHPDELIFHGYLRQGIWSFESDSPCKD